MQHVLKRVIKEERPKILAALADDPVQSVATLLSAAGIDFEQNGNEFNINTGITEGITIKVERN